MNNKLRRIRAPWRRLMIYLVVNTLFLVDRFKSTRAHVHWVGHYRRPRRYERPLILLLFAVAFLLLEAPRFALWSAAIGSLTSFVVIGLSVYQLFPRSTIQ